MIEALKIIIMACNLSIAPGAGSNYALYLKRQSFVNDNKELMKTKLGYQRKCQQRLVSCWLHNKRNKIKWPLSSCLEEINDSKNN